MGFNVADVLRVWTRRRAPSPPVTLPLNGWEIPAITILPREIVGVIFPLARVRFLSPTASTPLLVTIVSGAVHIVADGSLRVPRSQMGVTEKFVVLTPPDEIRDAPFSVVTLMGVPLIVVRTLLLVAGGVVVPDVAVMGTEDIASPIDG